MAIVVLLCVGVACANTADANTESGKRTGVFTVDASVGFESESVIRGMKVGNKAFVSKVEIGHFVSTKCEIYGGTEITVGIGYKNGDMLNRISPYVGISYDITDTLAVDIGYSHRFFTSLPANIYTTIPEIETISVKRDESEIYAGVAANVLLLPSLHCFYGFGDREITVEGTVFHRFNLLKSATRGLALELGAKAGYNSRKKVLGFELIRSKRNYCYYGASADLVCDFNGSASAKIGVAYNANSAKKDSWTNSGGDGKRNSIWFNASVNCSF